MGSSRATKMRVLQCVSAALPYMCCTCPFVLHLWVYSEYVCMFIHIYMYMCVYICTYMYIYMLRPGGGRRGQGERRRCARPPPPALLSPHRSARRVSGLRFQVSGFRFRISSLEFQVSGFGFQVSGLGSRVSGLESQVSGFGFQVSVFEFRVASHRAIGRTRRPPREIRRRVPLCLPEPLEVRGDRGDSRCDQVEEERQQPRGASRPASCRRGLVL